MKSLNRSKIKGYINDIAINATPLWDRELEKLLPSSKNGDKLYETKIERWVSILGSKELLCKRLRCNEMDLTNLPRLFGKGSANTKQPSWCNNFAAVLKYYKPGNAITYNTNEVLDWSAAIPFEEILLPFIKVYQKQVQKTAGKYFNVLTQQAKESIERQLLSHIGFIAGLSIGAEFYQFRFKAAPASSMESVWVKQPCSKNIYNAFTEHMYSGGMISFFKQYAVLARLLCQSVDHCVNNTAKFCRNYFDDFPRLKSTFKWKINEPGKSVDELLSLSDRHYNGQTVMKCMLTNGERVIYKPRNILPEITYNNFIRFFNSFDTTIKLKDIAALNKKDHGWVEYVQSASCLSAEEVKRYYQRVGMLLSVLHMLSVTDIHFENLIACGEHPVVVDLETMLDKVKIHGETNKNSTALLRVGLLPRLPDDPKNIQPDKSGICADAHTDIKVFSWKYVNTDQMQLVDDNSKTISNHRVHIKGKLPTAKDYLTYIIDGFKQGYFCFFNHKNEIPGNSKLFNQFDKLRLRTIVRSTETYAKIHLHLLHPEYLKNGIDRSIELEWLARPLMGTDSPRSWRIMVYEQERLAMEQLDIPHFTTFTNKHKLENLNDQDFDFFYRKRDSGIIKENLKLLSKKDYYKQSGIIEGAIKSRFEKIA